MKYNEEQMAQLILEVETEFKDYLKKAEQNKEEDLNKSENFDLNKSEFNYDEEDITEMNKMYASMSKAEAEAHYKSLKKTLFKSEEESKDLNKSEEFSESDNQEEKILKSEIETLQGSVEESKKENQELKKSIETLTSIISKVVKGAPKRKAVTQMGDIQYIKKSEESVEDKKEDVDYTKLNKSEINKILSSKIRSGEITKSEDKNNINKYCYGELKFDEIKYLL